MSQLRQTLRKLARSPGFTLATVATLAIAIGAITAIFSVVNGVLLEPLPYPESDRLVALVHQAPGEDSRDLSASPAMYFTYRDHNRVFESVALWAGNSASITGRGDPEEVARLLATHELLPTLRVQPLLGRAFTAAEDEPGAAPTVLLSYDYWQTRFGGDEAVVGTALIVDGTPNEVIGVLPADFRFLDERFDVLAPMKPGREFAFVPSTGERGIARLKDGITLAQASADVARMMPILFDTFPLVPGFSRERLERMQLGPDLRFLKDQVIGDLDDVLWVLMGTIAMLLLIACANVANLQLVRVEARRQELAIRAALGAEKWTITRALLLESVVLGLAGGVLGLALAAAGLPLLLRFAAQELPAALAVELDGRVLGFTLAVSLLAGLLFGAIPALKYAGPHVATGLRTAGRGHGGSRERYRARNVLVVAQVGLALVLLVASGLMIRTFVSLRDVDAGLTEPERVQTVRVSIPEGAVPDFSEVVRRQIQIEESIARIPDVEAVGFASRMPVIRSGPSGPFALESAPEGTDLSLEFRYVSPNFFAALGAPLVAGRSFEWRDYYNDRQVAVVSEAFARRTWGSAEAALGERLRRNEAAPWLTIVGVVRDIRHHGLERAAPDTIYLNSAEMFASFSTRTMFFFIRSGRVGTADFPSQIQRAVWAVDPSLPIGAVRTMGEVYGGALARTSLTLVLLAITGSMALLLGLVGIYAVLSYALAQRTAEIGIRMALGAQQRRLQRAFMAEGLRLVAVGGAAGFGGALALAGLMESLLFGVTAFDPATYAVVTAMLVGTAAAASYLPVRRAVRIDPMEALRSE